jgi:hypothetical protein
MHIIRDSRTYPNVSFSTLFGSIRRHYIGHVSRREILDRGPTSRTSIRNPKKISISFIVFQQPSFGHMWAISLPNSINLSGRAVHTSKTTTKNNTCPGQLKDSVYPPNENAMLSSLLWMELRTLAGRQYRQCDRIHCGYKHVCKQSEGNDIRGRHAVPLRSLSVAHRDYHLAFELSVSISTPRTQTDEDGMLN